jgi:hypothetical protein
MFDIIDNDSFDILVVWADGCPDGWLPVAVSQQVKPTYQQKHISIELYVLVLHVL